MSNGRQRGNRAGNGKSRSYERRLHALALAKVDLTATDRREVVKAMFNRRRREAVSYWLLLVLSMAIGTVGLVLNSTAVVIGAMLVAPLMGPIVELGMGLVVGSPVLTLRSFGRMAISIAVVMGGAALLTMLLPFQEVTNEVASRTSPTALDLMLAVFVAVAAAFTTARPGSDTTSAAAGTAIAIALVPPACAVGFGLGVGSGTIAGGAMLLFLTNLTAILLVSVLFFWILGFERVDAGEWEAAALEATPPNGILHRSVEFLETVFGSRYGRPMRVGLPLLLVLLVAIPLSRALSQVAWEVRTRSAVTRVLAPVLRDRQAVQTDVEVSTGSISTRLYLVGSVEDASAVERDLIARIAAETGVVPTVRVVAVPDVGAMRQATGSRTAEAPVPPAIPELRERLGEAVRAGWSTADLGPLLGWRMELPDSAAVRVRLQHLGDPLGPAAEALLARGIGGALAMDVAVVSEPYSSAEVIASGSAAAAAAWAGRLQAAAGALGEAPRLSLCVVTPPPAATDDENRAAVRAAAELGSRVLVDSAGDRWSFRYDARRCAAATAAAEPQ